ncbi:hypothetical protein GS501_06555 [Saccharibacter sp. 17.LH.SD]|uniref:hypothetical protein n=1 Tax=Saccharibacter sp. 17.LH.SD TaxID=2689393 RepID=UPI001370851F|nr:hypothetical protein [Saccharibacter sp. 17.LH.SD]MXV44703.1 hypothetical protein [Saccharibacter sp. 17.LH.SD]
MSNFDHNEYMHLCTDIMQDYQGSSNRGKIKTIRQYAEILVRKILNLASDKEVMLGNKKIINELKGLIKDEDFFTHLLDVIKENGNDCTHTQVIRKITNDDLKVCIESLYMVISYLFVIFFRKYRFGYNEPIMTAFSILPPVIRYNTLSILNKEDAENPMIVDKLSLAILKYRGLQEAQRWLLERKDMLSRIPSVTDETYLVMKEKLGVQLADRLRASGGNMFSFSMGKVERVSNNINEDRFPVYDSFESSLKLFQEKGLLEEDSEENKEFNSLMKLVYLGRIPEENVSLDRIELCLPIVMLTLS